MITTITSLPPEIQYHFNRRLLDVADIWERGLNELVLLTLASRKRYKAGGRRDREFQELVELFEELNEWKTAKEAYNKAKDKGKEEMSHLPIEAINRTRGKLGIIVRKLCTKYTTKCRNNDAF